jgi:hypothetical protein
MDRWFFSLVCLSFFFITSLRSAEGQCPGKADSVRVRHIQRSIMTIAVRINDTGPYDFLVDTGSQISVIDPWLASRLHLKTEGTANILGIGPQATTLYAHLNRMDIGSHIIPMPLILIHEISPLQNLDSHVRGIVGGNILNHFDVLFEPDKNLLCLDSEGIMQNSISGQRIPLAIPPSGDGSGATTEPVIAEVHLPRLADRPLYLLLDSGSNVSYLCDSARGSAPSIGGRRMNIAPSNGLQQNFVVLPPQDLKIGGSTVRQVSFVTPLEHGTVKLQVDGGISIGLFRRAYISYRNHFMVLEPW